MTKPSIAYLEERIAQLQAQLELRKMQETRWGENSDYPVETILMWRHTFGPQSRRRNTYTFVAVKRSGGAWQLASGLQVTWDTLCSEYLDEADGGEVFQAVKFDRI